jgi:hypothetical protein
MRWSARAHQVFEAFKGFGGSLSPWSPKSDMPLPMMLKRESLRTSQFWMCGDKYGITKWKMLHYYYCNVTNTALQHMVTKVGLHGDKHGIIGPSNDHLDGYKRLWCPPDWKNVTKA